MFLKISSISPANWLWSLFFITLFWQVLWCLFITYPAAFEKQLRRGKSWVYIPLRWKGLYKLLTLTFSRLLLVAMAVVATALFIHYTRWQEPVWARGVLAAVLLLIAYRLETFWTHVRYHQQEDAYYLLHDELRLKLDREGKDYSGPQFRNLAAYQHQQRLRKSDESGRFLSALRREAKLARQTPTALEAAET